MTDRAEEPHFYVHPSPLIAFGETKRKADLPCLRCGRDFDDPVHLNSTSASA